MAIGIPAMKSASGRMKAMNNHWSDIGAPRLIHTSGGLTCRDVPALETRQAPRPLGACILPQWYDFALWPPALRPVPEVRPTATPLALLETRHRHLAHPARRIVAVWSRTFETGH